MMKARHKITLPVTVALAMALAGAPGAWGVTEGWGYDVCGSPSEQIIISTDTQGYTHHISREYGASIGDKWSFGWVDYPSTRRSTWTGHDEVNNQSVYASSRIMYHHRYCAG